MKFIALNSILFCCCFSYIRSQESLRISSTGTDSVIVVDRVILIGNSHTKDFVITREMTLRPGTPITTELLQYDQDRIYSLRLFNQVQLRVIPSSPGMADLIVEVNERWYVFPFPIFGIRDRDWAKIYYGVGLLHSNFRGRNEKLYTTVVFGYDPSFGLAYRNPFLSEEGMYILDSRLTYNKVRNKSIQAQAGLENFDERHFSISLSIGRRFSIEHTVWLSAGYEIVDISDYVPVRTLSPTGKDIFPVLGIGYTYDSRDLLDYPGAGTLVQGSITKVGMPNNDVDLVRYGIDLRRYTPFLGTFVLANRIFTNVVAGGKTPSYNRTYFGYGERIRGHFKEVVEGENIFGVSSELHYILLSPIYFNVNFLPSEFGVWKFGIIAAAFGDAGTVWFRGMPFALNAFLRGYGVGIHFLLPYSAVLRTEYGWNEVRRGEFIVDIGTAF
ncbi:MAG: hypothetical protein HYR76_02900 [Ignavibacteria bacterium]|nr:hypothetical protein [Ignavibacteria bacterium]MBI3766208.1 hypothetical protein [Ignavibacteriales bacterium]